MELLAPNQQFLEYFETTAELIEGVSPCIRLIPLIPAGYAGVAPNTVLVSAYDSEADPAQTNYYMLNAGGVTGRNLIKITIDSSFEPGFKYQGFAGPFTVEGVSVENKKIPSICFAVLPYNGVNVTHINNLEYDEETDPVADIAAALAILESATYGNAAIKTLIDLIKAKTDTIPANTAVTGEYNTTLSTISGKVDAVQSTANTAAGYANDAKTTVQNGTYGNAATKTLLDAVAASTNTGIPATLALLATANNLTAAKAVVDDIKATVNHEDYGNAAIVGTLSDMLTPLTALWRRFFKKVVKDKVAKTIMTYADDDTTVLTTQPYTETDETDSIGAAV